MADVNATLAAHREAIGSLIAAAERSEGAFPKARTNAALNPVSGSATPSEARVRLENALARFDRECRTCEATGRSVTSATFGVVSVADYARFLELHTRHHCKQMP